MNKRTKIRNLMIVLVMLILCGLLFCKGRSNCVALGGAIV